MDTVSSLQYGALIMGLVGGLALFLYGMEQMTDALKAVAGSKLKDLLARLTTNRFYAAFAGAFITAIIQSSSVTTVLTIGFISAGLMSLTQSIGVIIGANVGTTVTAQIIAFKVTQYALLLVAVGFGLIFLSPRTAMKRYGAMVMGLGLIFLGMDVMSEATKPLRTYEPFIATMRGLSNPLLGILIGTVFTALVQSSSATTGVVIVLAGQGFIPLPVGISIIFGANIGTCVTALLATLGKPREAVQAALVHVVFNVVGVLIWVGLINYLAEFVVRVSPVSEHLSGAARLGADTPRQIANAHTVFNVANTFLFIGFTSPIARLVSWLAPTPNEEEDPSRPRFLDPVLLDTPDLALGATHLELNRVAEWAQEMTDRSLEVVLTGDEMDIEELRGKDAGLGRLHAHLVTYLGALSRRVTDVQLSAETHRQIGLSNYYEHIADMVDTNLLDIAQKRLTLNIEFSEGTADLLEELHARVCVLLGDARSAATHNNVRIARTVEDAKEEINDLAEKAAVHLAERLTVDDPNQAVKYRLESDLIEYLKRVYYFAKRIAKIVIEANQETPAQPNWMD